MTPLCRPYHPTQLQLFPPSPLDWLPKNHLAYFVMDVVRHLDLSTFHRKARNTVQGVLPCHPMLMVNLLVYGHCTGVISSRMIERKTYDDVAFRVLAAGDHPDHRSLRNFRRAHGKSLIEIFTQVLAVATKAGVARLGTVALTKAKGRASKRRGIDIDRVRQTAEALLAAAAEADKNEDAKFGKSHRGDELPANLHQPEARAARIRECLAELAADAVRERRGKSKVGPNDRTAKGKAQP